MLFGESAGAISVCYHLAAPESAGLFRAALMESGFCTGITLTEGYTMSNNVSVTLGCTQTDPTELLECLRSTTTEEVFTARDEKWWPVIDGYDLTMNPNQYLMSGQFNQVPLLLGTNMNEDSLWQCPWNENLTEQAYTYEVFAYYGEALGEQVLQLYPTSNYDSPVQALIDMQSDAIFICPTKQAADAISSFGIPVYRYSFNHIPGWSTNCLRVAHSYELPFIYPTLNAFTHYNFTVPERELSKAMSDYWINFAVNLTPNTDSTFYWPLYNETVAENIILDLELSTQFQFKTAHCAFWNSL